MSSLPVLSAVRSRAGKPDRFPRFTASREGRLSVEDLDDLHRAMLGQVERFRLMNSAQLVAANPHVKTRTLKNRLHELFHDEYLTRPLTQLARWWRKGPTLHYVYGLGAAGYAALHPETGSRKRAVLRLHDRRIDAGYIDHRLKLTTALLCFEQAAADGFTLHWSEGDAFRDATRIPRYVQIATERSTVDLPVNPDAYVTLAGDDDRPAHYFLEIDNGTEPIERLGRRRWERTSIHRKLAVYDALAPSKGDNDADRRRRSPFPFRVLTITTTPARMESMRQLARDQDPKHKGSRLFLFTTDARVTLERPGDILDQPIWWTPNDDDQPLALTD